MTSDTHVIDALCERVRQAGAAGSVWLYFSPWIYAIPLELDQHAKMRWLERWN